MDAQMNSGNGAVLEPGGSQRSIWSIIVGVFTAPSEAFEAYCKNPTIWVPLILTIALITVFSVLALPYNSQLQYDIMQQSKTLPPQVLNDMRDSITNPKYTVTAVTGMIFAVLPGVIAALLAWGMGSFIFGGESKFKTIWGVALLGGLIASVGNLVKIPLMMAKNSALVSLGPAALFADKGPTSLFYLFLLFLDIFVIWGIIITGIGYGKAFRISNGKGMAISIIISLLFIGIVVALQSVGMKFAGVETTWF